MAVNKALGVGTDNVLNWFDTNVNQSEPYYSVWNGKNILFSSCSDDYDACRQLLEDNLRSAEANGYDDIMILKLNVCIPKHHKQTFITDKTPVIASYTFRPCQLQKSGYIEPYNGNSNNNTNLILEKLNGIESRLNSLENEDVEEIEEEPQTALNSLAGLANTLLSNPQMQQSIVGFITTMINKFIPNNAPTQTASLGINGIPNNNITMEDKINVVMQCVAVIEQIKPDFINDLVTLANIAQTDPQKANFIMSMLPK